MFYLQNSKLVAPSDTTICKLVTINCPLHPETEHMFDDKLIGKIRSYATVEDRKNKGIESYVGGKDLCLSHFGYTS